MNKSDNQETQPSALSAGPMLLLPATSRMNLRPTSMITIIGAALLVLTAAVATCSTKTAGVESRPSVSTAAPASDTLVAAAELYVAPSGRPENSGSIDSPIDLASALSGDRVKPGTLIWMRDGVYLGAFESNLRGTPDSPIVVRQYPGERAIIDGSGARGERENAVLAIFGEWTNYWGFEVTNSDPNRTYRSQADRPQGVVVKAAHTKFINMIVHDTGNGFGFWREAVDSELYGNLIFNCGARDSNSEGRGHGHAIYTQNDSGTKVIKDNITFNQFGRGINAYPNPGSLRGFHIEGNISFNNGVWEGMDIRYPNILIGGYAPFKSERMEIVSNYTYHSPTQAARDTKFTGANLCLGCSDPLDNRDLVLRDNYVVGGVPVAYIGKWEKITLTGNTFYGNNGEIRMNPLSSGATRSYDWDNNSYYGSSNSGASFVMGGESLESIGDWSRAAGLDESSRHSAGAPTGVKVFVRPNQYEQGRANIAVYNWERRSVVEVSLNGVLQIGKPFEVRNAQDYFGAPVIRGTYDGKAVSLPMTGLRIASPVGLKESATPTGPEFNAFVVISSPGRTSNQTPATSPRNERRDEDTRTRRAAAAPRTPQIPESELRKFAGWYGIRNSPTELLIQFKDGQLQALSKNQPVYNLVPVSANRFRVDGKPPGFFVEFTVIDGRVRSLTATDGKGQRATILRN